MAIQGTDYDELFQEIGKQDIKWGDQSHHPDGTGLGVQPLAFLYHYLTRPADAHSFDLAQAAKSYSHFAFHQDEHPDWERPGGSWLLILIEEVFESFAEEPETDKLVEELLQVAAVAMQWRAAIRRRRVAEPTA